VPEDRAFDRQIVDDALRSMCLVNTLEDGAVRTRLEVPETIVIADGWMTTPPRGIDRVPPRYWVPVAGRRELRLESVAGIPQLAATLVP
jgi:hypothetical protein